MAGDHKCPNHDLTIVAPKPFLEHIDFFTFNRMLAGACTAFCVLVIFLHMLNHATHLSKPRQQIKIMRVSLLAPLYSILSLLQICFPTASVYIVPWLDVAQANCLASYFLLLCEYVSHDAEGRDLFFSTIEIKDNKRNRKQKIDGVKWFQQRWVGVFQYPVMALAVAIITCITQGLGVYCRYVSRPYFAKLWLSIVNVISPAIAFLSVILVAVNLREHMPHTKPITKLISVKLIVGLGFLQQIIFWILESTSALNPTDTMTYADKNIGIPALLSCIEMVPICLVVVWAYPVSPYYIPASRSRKTYKGGFLGIRAFVSAFNPADTIKGTVFALKIIAKNVPASSSGAAQLPSGELSRTRSRSRSRYSHEMERPPVY